MNLGMNHPIFTFGKRISFLIIFLYCFLPIDASDRNMSNVQETYAAVAEKAMPAVVTVYSMVQQGSILQKNSVGSGFLISEDGFIVTNYHVIQHADSLAVKFYNGETVKAKIIGVSQRTDLAVIKISTKKKLTYLRFADTEKVKIGHYAIAIGSPFALSQTMTTGIVSFKGRQLGLHYKEDYIQTDAAINPGNSGGPLLNIQGDVIGVNDCLIGTQSLSNVSGNVGLGFAIDGNLAQIVILCIVKSNLPEKPYIGITMEEYDKNSPPVVTRILKDSPADLAGIAVGDRIVKIGKKKVSTIWDVQTTLLAFYNPGDEVVFTVFRAGKNITAKIKIGKSK